MLGRALTEVLAKNFKLISTNIDNLDISYPDLIRQKIAEIRPDVVVNAAAYTAVDDCEVNTELANLVNGKAVGYLAEECKKANVKLIHFSTDYVFDGKNPAGYTEDAKSNPINAYGKSKLMGEKAILESGCDYAIIRTSWLFGERGKNFVNTMLKLGREKGEIKVVSDQLGCTTYTRDLAEATTEIINKNLSGIFHRTNEGKTNWSDFAKEIFQLAKFKTKVIPIPSSEYPTPAERPKNSVLLNTKLPKLRSWKEALGEYLKYI